MLRSMGREEEAIDALVKVLDVSPTDAEAWAELADLYMGQNLYSQAIFSMEEVLLITPNAWNVGQLTMCVCGGESRLTIHDRSTRDSARCSTYQLRQRRRETMGTS